MCSYTVVGQVSTTNITIHTESMTDHIQIFGHMTCIERREITPTHYLYLKSIGLISKWHERLNITPVGSRLHK